MSDVIRRRRELSDVALDRQTPLVNQRPPTERAWRPSHHCSEDVIGKDRFLEQLKLETRRSERTGIPLSLALFRRDAKQSRVVGEVEDFLQLLSHSKRDTDCLGYLNDDLVALLLLDTNEEGTRSFTRKVSDRVSAMGFSMQISTYPDQLLAGLAAAGDSPPLSRELFADPSINRGAEYFSKRILDVVGALVGIVIFLPVMLVIALAIALTSPGPVIFKQTRLGRGGVPFAFYKFRSMDWNADDRAHRDYVTRFISGDLQGTIHKSVVTPLFKMQSDPRVTRVGKIIRKTSADELPQLFNVLKGDMSLVGPRPPIGYEAEKYQPWHLRRILEVKPGITGLWQVEGRSRTAFDDMVRLDIRYVQQCSLALDVKILLKTVKVVLRCEGAS